MDVLLQPGGHENTTAGTVPGGRQRSSGTGGADGDDVRTPGGRDGDGAPRFDQSVRPGGYCWWYLDALSDDGQHGLTIIAFVGSVFSPYYAWARARRGTQVEPEDHVCINVALYGRAGHRWAMTERGLPSLSRSAREFQVGPSRLTWNGTWFELTFDEVECPWPRRLRGAVRIHPSAFTRFETRLDEQGLHRWGPIAPCARVELQLADGSLRWQGPGYFDSNAGDEPIHRPFRLWDWSRAVLKDGRTAVIYDVQPRQGPDRVIAQLFHPDGRHEPLEPPPRQALRRTAWGLSRSTRSEAAVQPARVLETLEDTPFYVRDVLSSRLLGQEVVSVHETLHTDRLVSWPVRGMLPFRMPRRR